MAPSRPGGDSGLHQFGAEHSSFYAFHNEFVDAAVVNGLGGEAEAAEVGALAGVGDDFEFADE